MHEKETVLLEFYKETSSSKSYDLTNTDVIIPGLFTLDLDITDGEWEVVGHVSVDPTKIDFPEFMSFDGPFNGKFTKGEISYQVEIPGEEVEDIHIYPSILAVVSIPEYILHALGRVEEIRENRRPLRALSHIDLRYSEHGDRVRALLPEEFKKPYYEMAKEKGFDLTRFYK